jgi:PucR C-terminal helix-turn-helix domain/GGDEF-like domain
MRQIAAEMLTQRESLADNMTAAIQAAVPLYANEVVDHQTLRATALVNVDVILGSLGQAREAASPESRANGRARAAAGVPLTAILEAYRVGARRLWERVAQYAQEHGADNAVVLHIGAEMWEVLDIYSQELAEGYREELATQAVADERQRSALFQALFEGRLAETNPWEAAELLRLPVRGQFVVIAAEVLEPGQHGLPRIEHELRMRGLSSAWRLQHDAEIGIVSLNDRSETLDWLIATVIRSSAGRVGISPRFDRLTGTVQAVTHARIALRSADASHEVVVFDRNPLAIAAVSAPAVMRQLSAATLAGLEHLPRKQRAMLLATFGAWMECGGSATAAGERLFVHRNTVHHRLRKLEDETGRSLSDPRAVAELSLAYETDKRLQLTNDTPM